MFHCWPSYSLQWLLLCTVLLQLTVESISDELQRGTSDPPRSSQTPRFVLEPPTNIWVTPDGPQQVRCAAEPAVHIRVDCPLTGEEERSMEPALLAPQPPNDNPPSNEDVPRLLTASIPKSVPVGVPVNSRQRGTHPRTPSQRPQVVVDGERLSVTHEVLYEDVEEWFGEYLCRCVAWNNDLQEFGAPLRTLSSVANVKAAYIGDEVVLSSVPHERPQTPGSTPTLVLTSGGNLTLLCQGPEGVPPVQIDWEFRSLSSSKFTALSNSPSPSTAPSTGTREAVPLHLTKVTVSHSGSYRCLASNLAGRKVSMPILVEIRQVTHWSSWSAWSACPSSCHSNDAGRHGTDPNTQDTNTVCPPMCSQFVRKRWRTCGELLQEVSQSSSSSQCAGSAVESSVCSVLCSDPAAQEDAPSTTGMLLLTFSVVLSILVLGTVMVLCVARYCYLHRHRYSQYSHCFTVTQSTRTACWSGPKQIPTASHSTAATATCNIVECTSRTTYPHWRDTVLHPSTFLTPSASLHQHQQQFTAAAQHPLLLPATNCIVNNNPERLRMKLKFDQAGGKWTVNDLGLSILIPARAVPAPRKSHLLVEMCQGAYVAGLQQTSCQLYSSVVSIHFPTHPKLLKSVILTFPHHGHLSEEDNISAGSSSSSSSTSEHNSHRSSLALYMGWHPSQEATRAQYQICQMPYALSEGQCHIATSASLTGCFLGTFPTSNPFSQTTMKRKKHRVRLRILIYLASHTREESLGISRFQLLFCLLPDRDEVEFRVRWSLTHIHRSNNSLGQEDGPTLLNRVTGLCVIHGQDGLDQLTLNFTDLAPDWQCDAGNECQIDVDQVTRSSHSSPLGFQMKVPFSSSKSTSVPLSFQLHIHQNEAFLTPKCVPVMVANPGSGTINLPIGTSAMSAGGLKFVRGSSLFIGNEYLHEKLVEHLHSNLANPRLWKILTQMLGFYEVELLSTTQLDSEERTRLLLSLFDASCRDCSAWSNLRLALKSIGRKDLSALLQDMSISSQEIYIYCTAD